MVNEYTLEIKDLMKDFIQHVCTEEEKLRQLIEVRCPVEPDLMGYTFGKILDFDVKYRIFEKVNYVICFKYKNTVATLGHYKLSYRLSVEETVKEEILEILEKVKILLEKALLKFADDAVKNNRYSLPNYFNTYKEKIELLEKNILKIPFKIKELEKAEELEREEIKKSNPGIIVTHEYEKDVDGKYITVATVLGTFNEKYWNLENDLKGELSYTIESYIENWFAFIEHIFSLLIPMTQHYDTDKEYADILSKDWRFKVEKVFGNNKDFESLIESLAKIKEIYRNRFSHGMFSREKQVHIQVPSFGMYPLWIGKKHCRGFKGTTNVLTFKIFEEVRKVFDEFYDNIKKEFPLQFNIINSGIPTFLDTSLYDKAFNSDEDNKRYIEAYWYHSDNQMNMDW